MNAIRTIQHVTGSRLTVHLPPDFAGRQVEVIVLPLEDSTDEQSLPPESHPQYAPHIMPKPPLSHDLRQEFERNPYPLRGTVAEFQGPCEPAVPPDDWEANS